MIESIGIISGVVFGLAGLALGIRSEWRNHQEKCPRLRISLYFEPTGESGCLWAEVDNIGLINVKVSKIMLKCGKKNIIGLLDRLPREILSNKSAELDVLYLKNTHGLNCKITIVDFQGRKHTKLFKESDIKQKGRRGVFYAL